MNYSETIGQACIFAADSFRMLGKISNLAHRGSLNEKELDMARGAISDLSLWLAAVTSCIAKRRQRQSSARLMTAHNSMFTSTFLSTSTSNEGPQTIKQSTLKRKFPKDVEVRNCKKAFLEGQDSNLDSQPDDDTILEQSINTPTEDFIDLTMDSEDEEQEDPNEDGTTHLFAGMNSTITKAPSKAMFTRTVVSTITKSTSYQQKDLTSSTPANLPFGGCLSPILPKKLNNTPNLARQAAMPIPPCLPALVQSSTPYLVVGSKTIKLVPGQVIKMVSRSKASLTQRVSVPTGHCLECLATSSQGSLRPSPRETSSEGPSTSQALAKKCDENIVPHPEI